MPLDALPISDITRTLIAHLIQRDQHGRAKYGTTLDRTDLTLDDWLQHMAEELLDGAGYALAAKRTQRDLIDRVSRIEAREGKPHAIAQQALATTSLLTGDEQILLMRFAGCALAGWPECDIDQPDMQAYAQQAGLLSGEIINAPCGDHCGCADIGEWPMECMRPTPLLRRCQLAMQEPAG
jgi:hypothetical protein